MTNENTNAEGGTGDSEKEGGKKPEFDAKDFVPKSQFTAALNNQEEKHKREMEALKAEIKTPASETKEFTRADLRALVESGDLTQDQADAHWDKQLSSKVLAEAGKVAKETVDTTTRDEKVLSEIDRYKAADPALSEEGSEVREKLKAEFKKLVAIGDSPSAYTTELKALKIVCGDVEAFELAKSGKNVNESDQQDGGNDDGGGGKKHQKFKDTLTPRQRKHYQKMIDNGIMKNWDEVKEEMGSYTRKVA